MKTTTLPKGTKLTFKKEEKYSFGKTYKSLEEFKNSMTNKYYSK